MDHFIEVVKAWYFVMVFVIIAVICIHLKFPEPKVVEGPNEHRTKQELKKAMRYHGVQWSLQDEVDGKWCFWRNDKKIYLFCHEKRGKNE